MVNTPVLFVPFARPEYAFKTFEAIKNAKPKKLYFYSDKARENMSDEVISNNQIRALVNDIDWNCELKTFFREKHSDAFILHFGVLLTGFLIMRNKQLS